MNGAARKLVPSAWSAGLLVVKSALTLGFVNLAWRIIRHDKYVWSKLEENATQLHEVEEHMLPSVHKLSADIPLWSRDIAAHSVASNQHIDRTVAGIDSVALTKLA